VTDKGNSGSVNEVTVTRLLNAPRAMVFKAWTDPNQVAEWWGPQQFTNRIRKWDAQAGGGIDLDMIGPDGSVYPMSGKFQEVVPSDRLVFTSSALDPAGKPIFEVLTTITLAEVAGRTTLTMHAEVISQGPDAQQYLAGMEAGWTQSLERLESLLARAGGKA
jgi:uncharacterized protein YndB with AHSA1/START domain